MSYLVSFVWGSECYMYDIIIVGAGHAGVEAAHVSGKKGFKTLLITSSLENIADMPCNPSIGGSAKGIVVREIDALGGLMGRVADESHFQIKMLNNTKGPAVRALRAQVDKVIYPKNMLVELEKYSKLTIQEGMVEDLIIKNNKVKSIVLESGETIAAKIVILTTGTYLKSQILVGDKKTPGAPHGQRESKYLSTNLKKYGLEVQRLKTGTPPRIKKDSIDFSVLKEELGDNEFHTFSFDKKPKYKVENQEKCYLLYTNKKTHQIIKDNLNLSSMYGGYVEGVGPRYCPSIEDKIVKFADKERHQLFLEPESIYYDEWYLQGFSTSMPHDIQELMVHSLKGLENAVISKFAYAIEYDALNPRELKFSLETKKIVNLYCAGQINGTSGYEEAAAQGLIAGINATLKLEKKAPLILKRNDAYIGVLIDDLITKGTTEPYRLLTSRAEYRLLLRSDNADLRLREYGYKVGLISKQRYQKLLTKIADITHLKAYLNTVKIKGKKTLELLKRPEVTINSLPIKISYSSEVIEQVELEIKYAGYIEKAYKEVQKMLQLESKKIPLDIDYNKVKNIASEARMKLNNIRPDTIGQASRISGINPADIALLAVYLKKEYANEQR